MSGPCRISYDVKDQFGTGLIIARRQHMKCWSIEEGLRAAQKKWGIFPITVTDFKPAQTFKFEYSVLRRETGDISLAFVSRRSRKDAQRWIKRATRVAGSAYSFRLVTPEKKNVIEIPPAGTERNEPAMKIVERLSPLPDIHVGDAVLVRMIVTHAGGPSALCGVKIGDRVIGIQDEDIVDVIKRPFAVGDECLCAGERVIVLFTIGDWATVRSYDNPPFTVETKQLRHAA